MSATTGDLLTMLRGNDPIGIVFYREDEAREDILSLCEILASSERACQRTTSVSDIFEEANKGILLFVTPETGAEVEAVRTLEGRRERLLSREVPAILFLLQGGEAEHCLNTEAHALSSFLRGLTYDPEPPLVVEDLEARRAAFQKEHQRTPDEWLEAWRRDEIEDNGENNLIMHEAWVLRTP